MGTIIAPMGIEPEYINAIVSKNPSQIEAMINKGDELQPSIQFVFLNESFHAAILITSFENVEIKSSEGYTSVMIKDDLPENTCIVIQLVSVGNDNQYRVSYAQHDFSPFLKYELIFFNVIHGIKEGQLKIIALSSMDVMYDTVKRNCLEYCKKFISNLHGSTYYGSEDQNKHMQEVIKRRLDKINIIGSSDTMVIKPMRQDFIGISFLLLKSIPIINKLILLALLILITTNIMILYRL